VTLDPRRRRNGLRRGDIPVMTEQSAGRRIEIRPFPASRAAVTAALRAGRRIVPVHGLVSCDVTEARGRLEGDADRSFTAYLIASVGRAAAAHPEVHAYRNWWGRLVVQHYVDVAALVEVEAEGRSFPMAHLYRDAGTRSVADITAEIRRVKRTPSATPSGRLLRRAPLLVGRIPGAMRLFYRLAARSVRLRRMVGTVTVTSVGMFGAGPGFGISAPTVLILGVLVGGMSPRPWTVDGRVEVREVVDLTVTVDHNVVDGAPAARFAAQLRRLVETAAVLDEG
jgi:pyruvate/2-oxoglutarate dehydrogenase complex dihydrolipoamide acyltransferase (E2) component